MRALGVGRWALEKLPAPAQRLTPGREAPLPKSRRPARELALRVLYTVESGHTAVEDALRDALESAALAPDQAAYAERLALGVRARLAEIDERLAKLLEGYDIGRVAAVDRNVLRMAAHELLHEPAIPPAVTLNEAIEIARKYSTAESGRFVNGVLGRLLRGTPKAEWDPATAPPEEEPEEPTREAEPEPEVEVLQADSEEAQRLAKVGGWKLRAK